LKSEKSEILRLGKRKYLGSKHQDKDALEPDILKKRKGDTPLFKFEKVALKKSVTFPLSPEKSVELNDDFVSSYKEFLARCDSEQESDSEEYELD